MAQAKRKKKTVNPYPSQKLKDGDKNWNVPCENCGETPTVHPTGLCGPCCWGEAETYGGNW